MQFDIFGDGEGHALPNGVTFHEGLPLVRGQYRLADSPLYYAPDDDGQPPAVLLPAVLPPSGELRSALPLNDHHTEAVPIYLRALEHYLDQFLYDQARELAARYVRAFHGIRVSEPIWSSQGDALLIFDAPAWRELVGIPLDESLEWSDLDEDYRAWLRGDVYEIRAQTLVETTTRNLATGTEYPASLSYEDAQGTPEGLAYGEESARDIAADIATECWLNLNPRA